MGGGNSPSLELRKGQQHKLQKLGRGGPFLSLLQIRGVPDEAPKSGDGHEERQSSADDHSDAIHKRLVAGFVLQSLHGLRLDLQLQGLDLSLLVGKLFSLIRNLFLQGPSYLNLPFLLLALLHGLVVLLDEYVTAIARVPDQTVRLRRRRQKRWLGQDLHLGECSPQRAWAGGYVRSPPRLNFSTSTGSFEAKLLSRMHFGAYAVSRADQVKVLRNSRRRILPEGVRGTDSTKQISRGCL